MFLGDKLKKISIYIYLFIVKRSELSDIKKYIPGQKKEIKQIYFYYLSKEEKSIVFVNEIV